MSKKRLRAVSLFVSLPLAGVAAPPSLGAERGLWMLAQIGADAMPSLRPSLFELARAQMLEPSGEPMAPAAAAPLTKATVRLVVEYEADGKARFNLGTGFVLDGDFARLHTARHVVAPLLAPRDGTARARLIVIGGGGERFEPAKLTVVVPDPRKDHAFVELSGRRKKRLREIVAALPRAPARPRFNGALTLAGYAARERAVVFSAAAAVASTCLPRHAAKLFEGSPDTLRRALAETLGDYFARYPDPLEAPTPLVADHRIKLKHYALQERSFCLYQRQPIAGGMSGAPVLDDNGRVAGVLSEGIELADAFVLFFAVDLTDQAP